MALSIYRGDEDSARVQLERWLATANVSAEWWPAFSAPVEETYALGRRDLQKTVGELWTQLIQTQVQPLADAFPFARTAEAAVATAKLEAALAPKQSFWSAFEAQIAPLLVDGRDGWRSREGRGSSLLPVDLLATVSQLSTLSSALWDKEGKPKPLLVRVRPLPLAVAPKDGPVALTSYLQAGGTTIYGFNQHADWTPVKIEWWHADSASVGVAIAGEGGKSFHAINVTDAPWSFWRLLARGSADERIFTWQVPGPDGRTLAVQFELKDDPWARFALH
jgi:type VI secretion system protein ImpL